MSHPKHHKHGQPKSTPKWSPSPAQIFGFMVAAIGAILIVSALWPNHSPEPTPAPAPAPKHDQYAHVFVVSAWCDHMPPWKESSDKRHLLIGVAGMHNTIIRSVEVRHHDKLLAASTRIGEFAPSADLSKMQLEGAFKEGMHGADLEVTITYEVEGVKYQTIMHCRVLVTH